MNPNILEMQKPEWYFHADVILPFIYEGKKYQVSIDFQHCWMKLDIGHTQTLACKEGDTYVLDME